MPVAIRVLVFTQPSLIPTTPICSVLQMVGGEANSKALSVGHFVQQKHFKNP